MLREFYGLFTDWRSAMVGLEDCEILFTLPKKGKLVAEKFLVRHVLAIQLAIEIQELDDVYWIPGRENPADGLTKLRSGIHHLLRLIIPHVCDLYFGWPGLYFEAGTYNPACLRPPKGVSFGEQ